MDAGFPADRRTLLRFYPRHQLDWPQVISNDRMKHGTAAHCKVQRKRAKPKYKGEQRYVDLTLVLNLSPPTCRRPDEHGIGNPLRSQGERANTSRCGATTLITFYMHRVVWVAAASAIPDSPLIESFTRFRCRRDVKIN